MRHASGQWYWTTTVSICEDCCTYRIDKVERLKRFSWVDLLWRRLVYNEQFTEEQDGSLGKYLVYCDGDAVRSVAWFFTVGEYFNRRRVRNRTSFPKPPLPDPSIRVPDIKLI